MPQAKGTLSVDIDELGISGQLPVTGLKGKFVFNGSNIGVSALRFGVGNKGAVEIQENLSELQSANSTVSLKGIAQGFTLEQLMDILGSSAKVKGGATEIALNLRSSGISLHQLPGKANGAVRIAIAEGVLDASIVNAGGDLLSTVVNAVNPMRKRADQTTLECAVAYLPLNNGEIILNNSFGVVH
ncbi:AsmA family protein [Polynucleobacter necessarius]|uniref:AsmA family protein n=1 Tax=Polynucleobacter necessarius TaxID=576610 RepID=UPI000E09111F|nr:AsmA family protein [Polynucleobacter necessarius]